MRRPTSALAKAVLGTALAATTVSAQAQQSPPVATPGVDPAGVSASVPPINAGRGARHLLRNGWDYITYQEYERALAFFREAETRKAELNDAERLKLKQGIDRAQRGLREATNGMSSERAYARSGAARRPALWRSRRRRRPRHAHPRRRRRASVRARADPAHQRRRGRRPPPGTRGRGSPGTGPDHGPGTRPDAGSDPSHARRRSAAAGRCPEHDPGARRGARASARAGPEPRAGSPARTATASAGYPPADDDDAAESRTEPLRRRGLGRRRGAAGDSPDAAASRRRLRPGRRSRTSTRPRPGRRSGTRPRPGRRPGPGAGSGTQPRTSAEDGTRDESRGRVAAGAA